jgi:hypothetical protein
MRGDESRQNPSQMESLLTLMNADSERNLSRAGVAQIGGLAAFKKWFGQGDDGFQGWAKPANAAQEAVARPIAAV